MRNAPERLFHVHLRLIFYKLNKYIIQQFYPRMHTLQFYLLHTGRIDPIIEIGSPLKNRSRRIYMISYPQPLTESLVADDYNVIVPVPRVIHFINGKALCVYWRWGFRLRC